MFLLDDPLDCPAPADHAPPAPVMIERPAVQTAPVVVASPHSGDDYTADFLAQSRLDPQTLRKSEDCYVHTLFGAAPALGFPLIRACFPRAFVDVNREAYELDPSLFDGPLPPHANSHSPRVKAGLGTIAKLVANGAEIYRAPLPVSEIERRVAGYYRPYHAALSELIAETKRRFGWCLLIDGHSMPSIVPTASQPHGIQADFVLGDAHGRSCAPVIMATAEAVLRDLDYTVSRNMPYAGGFTTRHYGVPARDVHVLQIEIARPLYMDEGNYARLTSFGMVAVALKRVMSVLATLPKP